MLLNPVKFVVFLVFDWIIVAFRLNREKGARFQQILAGVAAYQAAQEVNADILLPRNGSGERDACE